VQDGADGSQDTVTAFARAIPHIDRVLSAYWPSMGACLSWLCCYLQSTELPLHAELASIAELNEIMIALDDDDTAYMEAEGCAPEAILGEGDLLDDFVESALQADSTLQEDAARKLQPRAAVNGVVGSDSESEEHSDDEEPRHGGAVPLAAVRRCAHLHACSHVCGSAAPGATCGRAERGAQVAGVDSRVILAQGAGGPHGRADGGG
jgi:hypothetical protein